MILLYEHLCLNFEFASELLSIFSAMSTELHLVDNVTNRKYQSVIFQLIIHC